MYKNRLFLSRYFSLLLVVKLRLVTININCKNDLCVPISPHHVLPNNIFLHLFFKLIHALAKIYVASILQYMCERGEGGWGYEISFVFRSSFFGVGSSILLIATDFLDKCLLLHLVIVVIGCSCCRIT